MTRRPATLAVSVGCPSGIGPEVSVVAAKAICKSTRVLLVGDHAVIANASAARKDAIAIEHLVRVDDPADARALPLGNVAVYQPTRMLASRDARLGAPSRASGAAQLAWVDAACDIVVRGEADALVTGPVSKEAIVRSRAPGSEGFLGHTEHLQRRLRAREVVMAFWTAKLTTALVTTHLSLADVPRAVTPATVSRATYWLAWLLARIAVNPRAGDRREASRKAPRIGVAGLNPHAGELGLLGREETTRIAPGMERARARLVRAGIQAELFGPVPAESVFRLAVCGDFDGVVAMYHDQATIPMKLIGFGEAVNISLGLPIVRTSVDHGTAYDRAAHFTADAHGMGEAMELAARLVGA
jgi:4-hydroxythreonine-4-phosphate dehydrogenase